MFFSATIASGIFFCFFSLSFLKVPDFFSTIVLWNSPFFSRSFHKIFVFFSQLVWLFTISFQWSFRKIRHFFPRLFDSLYAFDKLRNFSLIDRRYIFLLLIDKINNIFLRPIDKISCVCVILAKFVILFYAIFWQHLCFFPMTDEQIWIFAPLRLTISMSLSSNLLGNFKDSPPRPIEQFHHCFMP